jgi:hypothetical protein
VIFGIILAAFTVFTVLTGNHFWHVYQHAVTVCKQNPATPNCNDLHNVLYPGYGAIMRAVLVTALTVPLLLGLFLGSPLISKEYEEGTNKLAWTQSVSRRKWLSTKLAWALIFAALYGLAVSLLVSWWARTGNALDHTRFNTDQFDTQGIMPVVYSVFFTAVGFTLSAWLRKTLLALAITLGLFVAFQVSIGQWVRPHYMTPMKITAPIGPNVIDKKIPVGAWLLRHDVVDKSGKSMGAFNVPSQCQALIQQIQSGSSGGIQVKASGGNLIDDCLNKAGYHQLAVYQPAYRYWDFQRIEAGMYLVMAALAVGATYLLVLKRDA